MNALRFWTRLVLAGIGFSIAILWLILLRIVRTSGAFSRQSFARAMSRLTCPPLGISVHVAGREHLNHELPCIYVANHQSYVDYPVAGAIFPGSAVVFARQVGEMPILGWLFHDTGNISVDRDNPTKATAALSLAESAIREKRQSVWIFPEGTRGSQPAKLGPFKRGAFRLAIATGAPIVPVVISPLKPNTDLRARRLRRHRVVIQVLAPVAAQSLGGANETQLRDHVHRLMQSALDNQATLA